MRLAALIGSIALIATQGTCDMAQAQASPPAIRIVDDGSASGSVQLPLGREFELDLGANPTTGYTWRCRIADPARVRLKSRDFRPSASGSPPRLGAGGTERFVFEAVGAGTEQVHLEYRRGETGAPARTYDLTVTVTP
jgi:predicted secreted protein